MGKPLPPIMGDKKGSTPTSTPSSPAPAGNGGNGMKIPSGVSPGVLLAGSGGWLLARMFFFGGALLPIEAIAILIADGFVCAKGDKVQKNLAALIIGFTALNLVFPGIIPWIRGFREAQLNPPAPIEQVAPPVEEPPPSTERVVVSGKKITLTGDGTYSIPRGRKSICLTNLGMKDGSQYVIQDVTVAGVEYIFSGTKCAALPDELEGQVIIDFFPGKDHGTPEGFTKLYAYWKSQPGGQAELPIIRLGE
jgi:hypothetical protein